MSDPKEPTLKCVLRKSIPVYKSALDDILFIIAYIYTILPV